MLSMCLVVCVSVWWFVCAEYVFSGLCVLSMCVVCVCLYGGLCVLSMCLVVCVC